MAKKLLLVIDVYGWAWHYMAKGIGTYAPDDYEIQIVTSTEFGKYTKVTPGALMNFDGICQFSWVEATAPGKNGVHWNYSTTVVASHGLEWPHPIADRCDIRSTIATRLRNTNAARRSLNNFDRVIAVTPALERIALNYNREVAMCLPGVDPEVFTPAVRPEYDPAGNKPLVVGWCGQPLGSTKGYNEILVPLLDELKDDRIVFSIVRHDQHDAFSQDEMAMWYKTLDLFISTSCSEGCQMPQLEAQMSGVPVFATNCGASMRTATSVVDNWARVGEETHGVVMHLAQKIRNAAQHGVFMEAAGSRPVRDLCREQAEENMNWETLAADWCHAIAGEEL